MMKKRGLAASSMLEIGGFAFAGLLVVIVLLPQILFPTSVIQAASSEKSLAGLHINIEVSEQEDIWPLEYPLQLSDGISFATFGKNIDEVTIEGTVFSRPVDECSSSALYSCMCMCRNRCEEVIDCRFFETYDDITDENGNAFGFKSDGLKNICIRKTGSGLEIVDVSDRDVTC